MQQEGNITWAFQTSHKHAPGLFRVQCRLIWPFWVSLGLDKLTNKVVNVDKAIAPWHQPMLTQPIEGAVTMNIGPWALMRYQ